MIPLSLLLCLLQPIFAGPSRTAGPTILDSLLDTISHCTIPKSNQFQLTSIPEGTYIGNNIEITNRCLQLSGELSNKSPSQEAHIIPQSGSDSNRNEAKFCIRTGENYVFSLTNSTMSLKSLHFSLIANFEEAGKQKNEACPTILAIVSDSILMISKSRIDLSSWTCAILISPSTFEESGTESSVVVNQCSISSESGLLRGLVETSEFPDCGASHSISIIGCSFNSQEVLGTDGIGLSLTHTARQSGNAVERLSSSLIGCSFVNLSSIGPSRQLQLSHLRQKMLGCIVSLTSSHLSRSTIRDVNNGGSLLCSNSSFSSLLSSPNTDPQPSITYPNGTSTQFVDNGTLYSIDYRSGGESTSAIISHCHFTGAKYAPNVRALVFFNYTGAISILSCSFTNHSYINSNTYSGGSVYVLQGNTTLLTPIYVEKSNFTNMKTNYNGAGMFIDIWRSAAIIGCTFEKCGTTDEKQSSTGGLVIRFVNTESQNPHLTVTNLVFDSCCASRVAGWMFVRGTGSVDVSDCLFNLCYSDTSGDSAGGLHLDVDGETPLNVTRVTFTDCSSHSYAAGMFFYAYCDIVMTDLRFFRCKAGSEGFGGGFVGFVSSMKTLTTKDCSFVECSSGSLGGAFVVKTFGSCVVSDCLVKDCCSGTSGAITFGPSDFNLSSSISLTRVAFVNNSVGQNDDTLVSLNSAEDTTAFVDVYLNYLERYCQPSVSIDDSYTTCTTDSIGMHAAVKRGTPEQTTVRVFDDAFHNLGPLLTEKVVVELNPESGKMELEIKGKIPIASQKFEMTIHKEEDKKEMKTEIDFVDGKCILTSPSPSLNLDFSTSYRITSIVGIVPSSSSSLANALTFPLEAWTFNLASIPSFASFTTPEHPHTLVGATADLVSEDQPHAFVILVFDRNLSGSINFVVEEEGKDVTITIHFEGSSLAGRSDKFIVVGEDRLLTHDTTYTIKSITLSPGTESPVVWMNETITFHIPKSSFNQKKAMSPEMKKLLSWLIPLIASLLVALIVVIVFVVLLRRRLAKSQMNLKEMEEQEPVELEKVEPVEGDCSNAAIHVEAISHSNFGPNSSLLPTEVGQPQSSKNDSLGELVEVMKCSGDFAVSTTRMNTTLYSVIHTQKNEIGKRSIGLQIVNGLKQVVAHRKRSDVLTQLSSHWILLDSAGNIHLKLDMNSAEAEQAALLAQKEQNAHAVGAEGEKCGMDGLRWRAPEVAAGSGQVDGPKASVFSLGLILWEIETGLVPYGEVDAIVAQKQSGTGIGPKLSDLHDDEFIAMLTRCLSVNPKERPTLTEIGEFLSSHKNESGLGESRNEMKTQVG
ncbi:hypothetical protein BLNAU_20069 [Blattamonas nauphoetae]|uniref:Protein kinase domain-containing protein n=1 Tax=Blattamonas nauphoetae TaxID=2049346 RepID=A0ABQ9WZX5_9EUKA|nr:hypothetical protein BLNAU_20069 [Blattamonas nauphoetae]